jgi:hypothetical protein
MVSSIAQIHFSLQPCSLFSQRLIHGGQQRSDLFTSGGVISQSGENLRQQQSRAWLAW